MTEPMKILIAYDGSPSSDAAVADLARAGLPADAQVVVMAAADVTLPVDADDERFPAVAKAHARAREALGQARQRAADGAARVAAAFPGWRVAHEAVADSPAWAIVKKAQAWCADLVVVGSQGRTGLSRLGSVSEKVLAEAGVTVRIGRAKDGVSARPPRLVLGFDGSPHAEAALAAVGARRWPAGTEVRLVIGVDDRLLTAATLRITTAQRWMRPTDTDDLAWAKRMAEASADILRARGLNVSVRVEENNPARLLVAEADAWDADTLFLGARGLTTWERLLLGSVSAVVAVRAPCSVEIVRPKREVAPPSGRTEG